METSFSIECAGKMFVPFLFSSLLGPAVGNGVQLGFSIDITLRNDT